MSPYWVFALAANEWSETGPMAEPQYFTMTLTRNASRVSDEKLTGIVTEMLTETMTSLAKKIVEHVRSTGN